MTHITEQITRLHERLARAEAAAGREAGSVSLLAVSKRHPVEAVEAASVLGLKDFGENYVQEAVDKITACESSVYWHFIGRIQSNKTRLLATHFHWVQTVSSAKIARRLASQRPAELPPLNVCLQLKLDDEGLHGGCDFAEAEELCAQITAEPTLKLRGLMGIPLPSATQEEQRIPYRRMYELYATLNQKGYALDTLSMGMSGDLEAAVLEGSTMVRIGTDLFGPRPA